MTRKEIAVSFLNTAGFGDVKTAFNRFVSHHFLHHNQYFKGDRESLMIAMIQAHQSSPNKAIDIKHIYEDGETIITHSLVTKSENKIAVVHIFRIENEKIVELWDLGQLVDPNSPNTNGLF